MFNVTESPLKYRAADVLLSGFALSDAEEKRNDWKTCFPDVSVQSPLPDSRRRWILNKRILAMEDEAIAHFYV